MSGASVSATLRPHKPDGRIPIRRVLIAALLLALGGCASDPPVQVSAGTWQQVDQDIAAASHNASTQAREHALTAMRRWMELVNRETDDEFIPWFSSYWTRQWLSMKVSWYSLNAAGEQNTAVNRLALYLQEQYQEIVLEPVAEEIDPGQIMEGSTRLYVLHLQRQVPGIGQRHGVPEEQFEQRLKAIAAITQAPGASLYQLLQADPPERLPAYQALLQRIHATPGGAGDWSTHPGISLVAQRTSARLVNDLGTSGAASAVSAMVGRAAGLGISLGVAVFTAIAYADERADTEAQLRKNLNAAFDEECRELLRSPERGVLAGVHQLSRQIENGLSVPFRYQPPR